MNWVRVSPVVAGDGITSCLSNSATYRAEVNGHVFTCRSVRKLGRGGWSLIHRPPAGFPTAHSVASFDAAKAKAGKIASEVQP